MRRSKIYLTPYGDGDDHRFSAIFKKTWLEIPLGVRRRLLHHWRTDMFRVPFLDGPEICLADTWYKRYGDGADAVGMCCHVGHNLFFHAPTVDVMPEPFVSELIAHELAHVFQYAYIPAEDIIQIDDDILEEEAHDLERLWGFDPDPTIEWLNAYSKRTVEATPQSVPATPRLLHSQGAA